MLNKGEYDETTKTYGNLNNIYSFLQMVHNWNFTSLYLSLETSPQATSYFIFKVLLISREIGGTQVHGIQSSFHAQLATVIL